MAVMPVQGTVVGDFVLHLVPIDDQEPMTSVAQKIAHHSVDRRVAPQDKAMSVRFKGTRLAPEATAAEAGVGPMDVLFVSYDE